MNPVLIMRITTVAHIFLKSLKTQVGPKTKTSSDTGKWFRMERKVVFLWRYQGPASLKLKCLQVKAFGRKFGCDWLMLKHQPITAKLSAKSFYLKLLALVTQAPGFEPDVSGTHSPAMSAHKPTEQLRGSSQKLVLYSPQSTPTPMMSEHSTYLTPPFYSCLWWHTW